jgi:hypothetical protein
MKRLSLLMSHLALIFGGAHGPNISIERYETVLRLAGGFGIAAQLPYLKRLAHGHNIQERFHACQIHLAWQIKDKVKTGL